ncbi:MAG: response regulator transcription factor [Acidimicrobiaceae bacterium]|nr:response regulator transcription factor [Acidimicrobiaceae bacterium]MBO0748666.1 response regulator transcription factor [Acidimicrobiaceae bacterium]
MTTTAATDVRVLVVDDQIVFRRVARLLIAQIPGFELVGEAETGERAISMAGSLDPSVVLMDLHLPGMDGAEATRLITTSQPGTVVILVSNTPAQELPPEAERCGAAAFVAKEDLAPASLEEVCRRALAGRDDP